jgi:single-strand selective monofunctional uracil DNA glycosylase
MTMRRKIRGKEWGAAWRASAGRWERLVPRLRRTTGWRIWNPGRYGERWHAWFRCCYPPGRRPLAVFGLNPGPYGMAQTGIPFTDLARLTGRLPRLAHELRSAGERLEPPGLAPAGLRPFLERSFESSSVRIYRFLERGWGNSETGWRDFVVANPCTLLFIDPVKRENRTPADLRKRMRAVGAAASVDLVEECERLRSRCAVEALEALDPRGAVLLGRNVQESLGPLLLRLLGTRAVICWEHPARAVPEVWASGLLSALKERRLSPQDSARSRRS